MKKKSKTLPVATHEEEAVHEEHCSRSCSCCCGSAFGALKTICLCASVLGAGLIVASSILIKQGSLPAKSAPQIAAPRITDTAIRKYIEANPQVIMDSIEKYLQKTGKKIENAVKTAGQPEAAPQPAINYDAIVKEIAEDKSNYSLGNPNGKFIIVEFFDYQCGWCKRTNAGLHEAIAKAEGKNIRWIPIDTPIFGAKSEEIARYVLAAGKQGKYAQMHEAVGNETSLSKETLIALGQKLGLDTKKLEADANGEEIKNKMKANRKYAEQLNINGVPFLIINGKPNPGALLGDKLAETVKESQSVK